MNIMRNRIPGFLVVLLLIAIVPRTGVAQTDLENALSQLTSENGKGYLQPAADLFGANMHSGYFHSAAIPRMGFTIEFAIIGMGAPVGDDQKSFTMKAPTGFNPATFKNATVFGGEGTTVTDATIPSLSYRGPDGVFNVSLFPLAVPQLTVGSVLGTQLTLRYIPIPKAGDAIPEGKTYAVGVRHSISQWLAMLPLDVSASFFYNSMKAGDLLDFKGTQFGVEASKNFSVLVVYGGIAMENSTLKSSYTYTDPVSSTDYPVSIELDGENVFRATVGVGLNLGVFKIFADGNFGSVVQFSGGIAFGN